MRTIGICVLHVYNVVTVKKLAGCGGPVGGPGQFASIVVPPGTGLTFQTQRAVIHPELCTPAVHTCCAHLLRTPAQC